MKYAAITSGTWRYELTAHDVLWAGRMAMGETTPGRARRAEDALAVLWTMTQLFSPPGQRSKYGGERFADFTSLIRAYSQPINPLWLARGHFCAPGGRGANTGACAPARLRHRAELQQTPWRELAPQLRAVVLRWAKGKTRNPVPRATEFATAEVAGRFVDRNPGSVRVKRVQNTFVATSQMRALSRSALPQIEVRGRAAQLPIGVALASLGVGAALAWTLTRSKERT